MAEDSTNDISPPPQTPKCIQDGWFSETEAMWPGQKFSLALEEFSEEKSILFQGTSDFQSILVFQSAQYGKVLVLDGVIQLTERDEFAYQEMITHIPLFSHPHPRNILIVGGGDGAVLREVCRHPTVTSITLVEIDPMVVDVAQRFFGDSTAVSFEDERLELIHDDAAEFLKKKKKNYDQKKYDVILTDSSDPVGPAETLFDPGFFELMFESLEGGGVVCAQGECFWIHLDLISDMVACCGDIFDVVDYASAVVPTYPCGQIGFLLAGKGSDTSFRNPKRIPTPKMQDKLRFYNPMVHRASFVLPQFVEKRLAPMRLQQNGHHAHVMDDDDIENNEKANNDCFLEKCVIQ